MACWLDPRAGLEDCSFPGIKSQFPGRQNRSPVALSTEIFWLLLPQTQTPSYSWHAILFSVILLSGFIQRECQNPVGLRVYRLNVCQFLLLWGKSTRRITHYRVAATDFAIHSQLPSIFAGRLLDQQPNSANTLSCFFTINFNIALKPTYSRSSSCLYAVDFQAEILYVFLPVLMLEDQPISTFLIYHPNNTWWRTQAFKFLVA